MLSSEDKILIKTCDYLKDRLPEKEIPSQTLKRCTLCDFQQKCTQPVLSNGLQEAVGHFIANCS